MICRASCYFLYLKYQGWSEWYGLVGNSKYYNYEVSNNGVSEQVLLRLCSQIQSFRFAFSWASQHGTDYAADYFTDVVARRGLQFLKNQTSTAPFLAVLGSF